MTLLHWMSQMPASGPTRALVEARGADGVSIVDLYADGEWPDREVIVSFQADGNRRRAERVLSRWARTTGYRRIWFPDRVEDCGGSTALVRAATTCSACAAPWADDGAQFWQMVRQCGFFPMMCPICGGDLPQWTVRRRPDRGAHERRAGGRSRSVSPSVDTQERR